MSKKLSWILLLLPTMAMSQNVDVAPSVAVSVPQLTAPELQPVQQEAPTAGIDSGLGQPLIAGTDIRATATGGLVSEGAMLSDQSMMTASEPSLFGGVIESRGRALEFLKNGGPSIWAIAALSVITVALILWKIWCLALIGAWSRGRAGKAIAVYQRGQWDRALEIVQSRRGIRSKVVSAALEAVQHLPEDRAREETARVAKRELASASSGLRALELIATIAPLLGLLGTVLGMIAAFQALQDAGSRADPSVLAGGIWEALLTTAAGMAVAIPAAASLTWFESVIERIRRDVEDGATVIFVRNTLPQQGVRLAAE